MASDMLRTPTPVTLAVRIGCSQEVPTKLWAAKLYTSSGFVFSITRIREERSVISPSTNSTSCSMRKNAKRQYVFELLRGTSPNTL